LLGPPRQHITPERDQHLLRPEGLSHLLLPPFLHANTSLPKEISNNASSRSRPQAPYPVTWFAASLRRAQHLTNPPTELSTRRPPTNSFTQLPDPRKSLSSTLPCLCSTHSNVGTTPPR